LPDFVSVFVAGGIAGGASVLGNFTYNLLP